MKNNEIENINNESLGGENLIEAEQGVQDIEEKIMNESEETIKEGEDIFSAVEASSGLNSKEIEEVRNKTGILDKLSLISGQMKELASHTRDKIYRKLKIEPHMEGKGGFDPREKLKAVRKSPRKRKKEGMDIYYEKYIYQKKGLAQIQHDIIEEINTNPEISKEELLKKSEDAFKKYGITETQIGRMEEVLESYEFLRDRTAKFVDESDNEVDLFKKTLRFEPRGEIRMIPSHVSIGFECDDVSDYIRAKYGNDNPKDIDMKVMSNFGCCIIIRDDSKVLGNLILINTSAIKQNGSSVEAVVEHENQHAINSLFYHEKVDYDKINDLIDEARIENNAEKKELLISRVLREYRKHIELRATDEILAHYKGGDDRNSVLRAMVTRGGGYDFLQNEKNGHRLDLINYLGKENSDLIDKCIYKVYSDEYRTILTKAIAFLYSLMTDKAFTEDHVIALFQNEPISKWSRLIDIFKKQNNE